MVDTKTTTRGAVRRRRTTAISMTAPNTSPMTRASANAAQNGTWYWIVSKDKVTAPTSPIAPTAKLMIRVAR